MGKYTMTNEVDGSYGSIQEVHYAEGYIISDDSKSITFINEDGLGDDETYPIDTSSVNLKIYDIDGIVLYCHRDSCYRR